MTAYVISQVKVHDPDKFAAYPEPTMKLVERYGGKPISTNEVVDVEEGCWPAGITNIVEFPDMAAIRNFLDDPDYQPLKKLRQSTTTTTMVLARGGFKLEQP